MRRESWRRIWPPAGVATPLVLGAILFASPSPRRVSGSVPAVRVESLAMLESQSEFERANQALATDSLPLDAPDRSRARVRFACRLGRDAEALQEIDLHPDAFDAGTRALLRALLQMRLGNPAAALTALEQAKPPAGLDAFAALVEAEAAAALGSWDQAHRAAERAGDAPLPTEMRQRLLVVRGLAAQHGNDTAALRRMAPELGDAARRDDRTGLLLFALAQATAQSGDTRQAEEWLLDLLEARPTPAESAYAVLQRRAARPGDDSTPVTLRLARYEMRSGRGAVARARLQTALGKAQPAAERAEMELVIAETYLRAAEYSKCIDVLARAATVVNGTRFEPERLRLRARALRRSGQRAAAMNCYSELARRFPSHPVADDALYEVGWLHEVNHELRAAEQAYVRCERAFPRGSLADDTVLRAGLCALRGGRPAEAATHLAGLVQRHPKSNLADNALYWQMLAQVGLRDPAGALGLRDRLERDFPRSYFTVLARQRIERGLMSAQGQPEMVSGRPATTGGWPAESGIERAQRTWEAYEAAIATLRRAGLSIPDDFQSQTRLWNFLQDTGFATEAAWEARRLEKRYEEQPGALLELLAGSHARGASGRLVRLAYLIGQRVEDPAVRDALEIILYPAPYGPTFAAEAARHGLSESALLGLARQESAFDARIDSGAGARGLMQLMPEVGRRLWNDAGRDDWHVDRLYDPAVNVELGCVLLAEELKRAGGNLPQALAAYNAGGEVAEKWMSRLSVNDPPEIYVDLVEYAETRSYLKNVLGNIETYRRLYALP